jgi:hypothetical protein
MGLAHVHGFFWVQENVRSINVSYTLGRNSNPQVIPLTSAFPLLHSFLLHFLQTPWSPYTYLHSSPQAIRCTKHLSLSRLGKGAHLIEPSNGRCFHKIDEGSAEALSGL